MAASPLFMACETDDRRASRTVLGVPTARTGVGGRSTRPVATVTAPGAASGVPDSQPGPIERPTFAGDEPFSAIPRRQRSISPADIFPDVPRDAIPPLFSPEYLDAEVAGAWLQPEHLVLGFEWRGDARAYPLLIMNWHEIVNDRIGERDVVVTYCPLCRTGLVFDRHLADGTLLTFGNTGALYESAMVMYDHQTDSQWWQAAGEAITGPLKGAYLELLPAITATWSDWRALWPETLVLSRNTGYERDYDRDIFAGYSAVDSAPVFPVSFLDDRLRPKERVLGVEAAEGPVAYSLTALGPWAVLHDLVEGRPVVVFSGPSDAGAVFEAVVDGQTLRFVVNDERFLDTDTGSTWDLSGRATAGPLKGKRLVVIPSFTSYWFSWATVWPETRIEPQTAQSGASSATPIPPRPAGS